MDWDGCCQFADAFLGQLFPLMMDGTVCLLHRMTTGEETGVAWLSHLTQGNLRWGERSQPHCVKERVWFSYVGCAVPPHNVCWFQGCSSGQASQRSVYVLLAEGEKHMACGM